MLDNSPRGASATIPAPMLQPTYIPVERSIRTGSAEDLHKLRFELAHVVQHFKRVGVPEELREWHQRSVQYLRATNPGKAWDVEE